MPRPHADGPAPLLGVGEDVARDHLQVQRGHRVAERVRETLARFKELQDIIALLGVEELSQSDQLVVKRARRLQRFLTQPFAVTEAFTGQGGRSVTRAATIAGCQAILDGRLPAVIPDVKNSPRNLPSPSRAATGIPKTHSAHMLKKMCKALACRNM